MSVSVTLRDSRSHWVVAGPVGMQVEWDAEFINEKPGELIAWQSMPGSAVQSAGSVRFEPIDDGQVHARESRSRISSASWQGGRFCCASARFAPDQQLETDLRRFKERMESSPAAS